MSGTTRWQYLLAAAAIGWSGCSGGGDGLASVKGQVLLDGKPLTAGVVVTMPEKGRGARGEIDSAGRFVLTSGELGAGATIGTHRAAVIAVEESATFNPEAPRKLLVPQRYSVAETSGLVIQVESGKVNEAVLNLSSRPER